MGTFGRRVAHFNYTFETTSYIASNIQHCFVVFFFLPWSLALLEQTLLQDWPAHSACVLCFSQCMMYLSCKHTFSSIFFLFSFEMLFNHWWVEAFAIEILCTSLLKLGASSLVRWSKFPSPVACQHPGTRNLCSKQVEGCSPVSLGLALCCGALKWELCWSVWEHLLN